MKKKFLLTDEKKDSQRVLESIKHNIRKYIKREKRKDLPEGSNFWKINCKFGQSEESTVEIRFEDLMKNINEVSTQNLDSFYIELVSEAVTMDFKKKEEVIELEESEINEDLIDIKE
ncbi:MAG: hypothetical protein KAJ49_01815 [Arcobacteraceae bacterium]|nr:hypothetical protein [Arcobacteraceae bacterium]